MSLLTNFFKQKAAVRPQKIGLKAAAIVHVKYEYSIQYKQEDKKYLRLFWFNHSGMNTIYKKKPVQPTAFAISRTSRALTPCHRCSSRVIFIRMID